MSEGELLEGGCYCGAVRFRSTGPVAFRAQCHCRACQHIAGGAQNYFMLVDPAGFEWTGATPASFERPDLDAPVKRYFCPTCGTHVAGERPGLPKIIVKVGALDDPSLYGGPFAAIFCEDKQPFHVLPDDLPAFDQRPPSR